MRRALRTLRGHLGVAAAIVGTLAVALAFVIASVGLLNGLLRRPYPYPKLQQILLVRDAKPREGAHQAQSIASGDFLDARRAMPAFVALAAWRPEPVVVTSAGAEPERVQAIAATANFFTTLGIVPIAGSAFEAPNGGAASPDAGRDTAARDAVAVLSDRLVNSRFGGDRSIVGHDIGLNGRATTVVGIIRDEDCYPPGVDVWVPLVFTPAEQVERAAQRVSAFGRLADSSTRADAAGQLTSLARTLALQYPLTNRGRGFELMPLQREQYEFTAPLFVFVLAAAALVLALAMVNVGSLAIARTLDRRRELAVRATLGASAAQIASAAAADVLLLTMTATACAMYMAGGVLNAVRASLPAGIARWIAGWSSLAVDAGALAAGAGIGLFVSLALGGVVGIVSVRAARETGVSVRVTRRATWGRRALVAGEVSLAAALMLAASVMVAGFNRIAAAFENLAPAHLLKFTLTLPESRYPDAVRVAAFHSALLDRLRALPAVERAALIRNEPGSNVPNPLVAFQRDDAPTVQASDARRADVEVVSPAAFDTLRLELLAGRSLGEADGPDAARVAVVSQTAARRFWPDRVPVGATIRLGADAPSIRIVGVVSDLTLNWYDPETRPIIFLPDAQSPARTTTVILRTRGDPLALARPVRAAVSRLDDRQPVSEMEPLSTTIGDSLSPIRIIERLLIVGAALAAALAAFGIYGVLAHWVGSRTRELGVRFALGATRAAIARLVLREALLTAGAGCAAGLASTSALVRLADRALLGVPTLDVRAMAIVAGCALVLTIAGALAPARRAARVDVADLLRLD